MTIKICLSFVREMRIKIINRYHVSLIKWLALKGDSSIYTGRLELSDIYFR